MATGDIKRDAENRPQLTAIVDERRVVPLAVVHVAEFVVVAIGGNAARVMRAGHPLDETLDVRHIGLVYEADLIGILAENVRRLPTEDALGPGGPIKKTELFVPLGDYER